MKEMIERIAAELSAAKPTDGDMIHGWIMAVHAVADAIESYYVHFNRTAFLIRCGA